MTHKICTICNAIKELNEYYFSNGKYKSECKCCYKRHYYDNIERVQDNRLRRQYSITKAEYTAKWHLQSGECDICRRKDKLVIDHNHATGRVRSLLCNACNKFIGLAKESIDTLTNSIHYLKRHAA